MGARPAGRPNRMLWLLLFMVTRNGDLFMSPNCHMEFEVASQFFENSYTHNLKHGIVCVTR